MRTSSEVAPRRCQGTRRCPKEALELVTAATKSLCPVRSASRHVAAELGSSARAEKECAAVCSSKAWLPLYQRMSLAMRNPKLSMPAYSREGKGDAANSVRHGICVATIIIGNTGLTSSRQANFHCTPRRRQLAASQLTTMPCGTAQILCRTRLGRS